MPSLDFDAESEQFTVAYRADEKRLREAASSFATLVQLLLSDNASFETPVVSHRVKDKDECIAKFKRKYLAQFEKDTQPFEIRPHITDLIGLRVVCLYENDLHAIADVLAAHFTKLGEVDKSKSLDERESEFGYKALHLDVKLNDGRSGLPEYSRFKDLQFEIQIRTAIQDAWSTLDHKIKYKKSIPGNLKRRINRLAALFELADQEFLLIKKETQELDKVAKEVASKSVEVKLQGQSVSIAQGTLGPTTLNAAEFIALCRDLTPGYPFDPAKADAFVQELVASNASITASSLSDAIRKNDEIVEAYKKFQYDSKRVRMNPYTVIRHILYLSDKRLYLDLMFSHQRSSFDEWLMSNNQG
jgi:putative GTP pyrophosphokinase